MREREIERVMEGGMKKGREEVVGDLLVFWVLRGLGYWEVKKVRREGVERLLEGKVWIMRGRKKRKREWKMGVLEVGKCMIEK